MILSNYYSSSDGTESLDGKYIPMFLKISGKLTDPADDSAVIFISNYSWKNFNSIIIYSHNIFAYSHYNFYLYLECKKTSSIFR